MAFITNLLSSISAVSTIVSLLRELFHEIEDSQAQAKRDRLNVALGKIQNAKTDDEKKSAIQAIASNSF